VTAADVLDQVLSSGGRIVADEQGRPRLIGVPPSMRTLVVDHLNTIRAIVAAMAKVATATPPAPSSYAHPWPDSLPGLGRRGVGPFGGCASCERWSWARYGPLVLCLFCAKARVDRRL
jgi:hypothetical protein